MSEAATQAAEKESYFGYGLLAAGFGGTLAFVG